MLRGDDIKDRLGVERCEEHYRLELKDEIIRQYDPITVLTKNAIVARSVSNPSPNHRETATAIAALPKKYIANGFACRHIPNKFELKNADGTTTVVTINKDLTDMLCAFLSPTRPYGYCFAYSGGAHKSLRGHFFFYKTDLEAVGATMHDIQRTHDNPQIYAVLCGRMTLKQKEIARQKAEIDTRVLAYCTSHVIY